MDGYLYNLDPYRQASAGYYAPRYPASYALERRSSYADPLSPFARVPVDPYAGYGAAYPTETLLPHRYVSAPTSPPFRQRPPRSTSRRKGSPPQNLGPRKKPFKQTQKVRFSEEKERPSSKKGSSQAAKKAEKTYAKAAPMSQAASLAKETKELHSLFRTGVDANEGVKSEGKKGDANGTARKRKADSQMQNSTPTKNAKNANKQKGKKKKQAKVKEAVKTGKAERRVPTEEEIKEFEAALEMQRGFCKGVSQFLGLPETKVIAVANGVESDGNLADSKKAENDSKEQDEDAKETEKKHKEPQRTSEEEKEAEIAAFKFFSNLFAENQELLNLYVDKYKSGSFECLVCHCVDPSKSKTFWNVVSLVMHAKMRKQMQPEHSGYARAVSAVLGWDYQNTPKVPRNTRPATTTKKSSDQVKDATKQEAVQDLKETQTNVKEDKEGETTLETASEDAEE
ncbi:hypothetical protein L7F22_058222 [Adiantum nelumboides]|nr:hypothetical protein [Adiantum nelumboides]